MTRFIQMQDARDRLESYFMAVVSIVQQLLWWNFILLCETLADIKGKDNTVFNFLTPPLQSFFHYTEIIEGHKDGK